jgi:hypothetical protein
MSDKPNVKPDPRALAGNIIEFPKKGLAASGVTAAPISVDALNQRELVSVKALTSYVAHNKRVSEDVVRASLHAEFNVEETAKLRRDDFERVIKFLVDLRAELLIN